MIIPLLVVGQIELGFSHIFRTLGEFSPVKYIRANFDTRRLILLQFIHDFWHWASEYQTIVNQSVAGYVIL
jgi:hypothetical protein